MYALCNMHTVWRNIKKLSFEQRKMSNADFRFLIKNHTTQISETNPTQPEQRTTQEILLLPRRDENACQEHMSAVDAPNDKKPSRCRQCRSKTGHKCTKCSSSTCVVALCQHKPGGKQCWNYWHTKREFGFVANQSDSRVKRNYFQQLS